MESEKEGYFMDWKNFSGLMTILFSLSCSSKFSGRLATDDPVQHMEEARVNVVGLDNNFRSVCAVDEDGEFSVESDMPDGLYLVEAILPGFAMASYKLKVDDNKNVLIRMKTLPDTGKYASPVPKGLDMGRASGSMRLMPPRL